LLGEGVARWTDSDATNTEKERDRPASNNSRRTVKHRFEVLRREKQQEKKYGRGRGKEEAMIGKPGIKKSARIGDTKSFPP